MVFWDNMSKEQSDQDNRIWIVFQQLHNYLIFSVTRLGIFSFQNNPKNLDPSYKTDLDLWDCLGRVKLVVYQTYVGMT